MNSKQIRQLEETVQQVQHSLGNALISLRIVRANFEAFPPEMRVTFEEEWQRVHHKAIGDLCASLTLFRS